MKKTILKITLYIVGIFCIAYPICCRFLEYRNHTQSIYDYKKELSIMQEEELKQKKEKAEEFNKNNSTETTVVNPSDINSDNENIVSSHNFLELGEMIGYISIPKINIELPIYEGITLNNLNKGVSHMENTSLPNGNLNTHSILAGHTGLSQIEIFDNIDALKVDDEFYINFYGITTKYTVIHETIVLPEDTEDLKVEDGKCLVTLVTCTPKSVNTHRLLVTGQKIEEKKEEQEENNQVQDLPDIKEEIISKTDFEILIEFVSRNVKLFLIILFVILLMIIISIIKYIKKKIKKSKGI